MTGYHNNYVDQTINIILCKINEHIVHIDDYYDQGG